MPIKKTINCILKVFAVLLLMVIALPNAGVCAAREASTAVAMTSHAAHSCCAATTATTSSCTTAQMTNECCCKAAPLNRAATPGLIATPSSQFTQVAVLPPTAMPASYQAQRAVWRDSAVAHAPPPKIYIFYRSLLI